ncbi:MAG: phosphoglycerate kinase [Elusimicrobia bacterium]|nr:phosphoglycerate kinase [Elusimicrobiota bacterium]
MKLQQLPLNNKRVLLRVDYNVALENGRVAEPKRIEATLPTLRYLLERKATVIVLSHLGRPKGQDVQFSLKPVTETLASYLKKEKLPHSGCSLWPGTYPSAETKKRVDSMEEGEILLLENLRFNAGEEKNDAALAKGLAELGDCFVQEAFGALHRAHASVDALPRQLPSAFGFLVEKEIEVLTKVLTNPPKPFVVLLGGVKVSDKIGAIENFLKRGVDKVLVGGALAYTFLSSQGIGVGQSPVEKDWVGRVGELMKRQNGSRRLILRQDHWIVQDFKNPTNPKVTDGPGIPEGWEGMDVGPKTLEVFGREIAQAKTIFWNGPVGVIEVAPFEKGSSQIAALVAAQTKKRTLTVLGGGDTIHAISKAKISETAFSHVSTGGGATIEFLEGKTLPGIAAIQQ